MSARLTDLNGYITIRGNPISKVGVFEYSGAQVGLMGEEAGRIVKVFRPEETLADSECIESFKLVPFLDGHVMLGSEDDGLTPPERAGVQGMIGEDVYFEYPYLKANIRIVSESLKHAINNGKIELSPGYRCTYVREPGEFNGERYEFKQQTIRANHLALVEEGRTGPDVAVLDKMTFTVDSATLKEAVMAEEVKDQEGSGGLDRIKALIEELKPLLAEQAEAQAMLAELGLGKVEEEREEIEIDTAAPVAPAASDEEVVKLEEIVKDEDKSAAMDAKINKLVEARIAAMDSRIVASIADRDNLAGKLSEFVGAFDSAAMTVGQVAAYGVKKLGIPCAKGSERIALDAWMHGRTPERHKATIATDSKGFDIMKKWGAQK